MGGVNMRQPTTRHYVTRRAASSIVVAVVFFASFANAPASTDASAPITVSIPVPGADPLVFKAVFLGIDGNRMFNSRHIRLGSREEGDSNYKTRLVDTLLAGGFVAERDGNLEWLYYLSETEVQRSQWRAFMIKEQGDGPNSAKGWRKRPSPVARASPLHDDREPQTGITIAEIHLFIEALNTWMLSQRRDRLPSYHGAIAFARLPTEAEWAFAARGGLATSAVRPQLFDARNPYGDAIRAHEWLGLNSGPGGHAQEVAKKKPNPLGLYDMLGNVQEYTINLFGPEYQQGRLGQYAIRGAKYNDSPANVSVANRTEAQPYYEDGTLPREAWIGFRLALGTAISASRAGPEEFDRAFAVYARENGLPHPGPTGESSPASQATQDAVRLLQEEREQLHRDNKRLSAELTALQLIASPGPAPSAVAHNVDALRKAERRIQEFQRERDALQATLRSSTDQRRRLDEALRTANERNAELQAGLSQAARLRERLSEREEELARLRARVAQVSKPSEYGSEDITHHSVDEEQLAELVVTLKSELEQSSSSNIELSSENDQLRDTISAARREISELTTKRDTLKSQVTELLEQNAALTQHLTALEKNMEIMVAEEAIRLLADKEEELERARQRIAIRDQEIVKNLGRVRYGERRLVEALLRQASANAYLGFRSLVQAEEILKLQPSPVRDKRYRDRHNEGQQMVLDYWRIVVEIAQDTDPALFDPMKREVEDWLRDKEESGDPGRQRRSLDMIARHVTMVRGGAALRPLNLVRSFTQQPEFR
jgi:hypothetical protein